VDFVSASGGGAAGDGSRPCSMLGVSCCISEVMTLPLSLSLSPRSRYSFFLG
jgi:hypothetical protein